MKYTCTIPCFDLEQTALSVQCFRLMPGKEPGLWSVISQGKLLSIRQNDSQFTFECEEGSLEYWLSYFDVSTEDVYKRQIYYLWTNYYYNLPLRVKNVCCIYHIAKQEASFLTSCSYPAEEGSRTLKVLLPHGPEPCASANSATSAFCTELFCLRQRKLL